MKFDLKIEREKLKKSKDSLKVCEQDFKNWKHEFPNRDSDSLLSHGRLVVEPVVEYYYYLFILESSDNYVLRQCAKAFQVFDLLFLRGKEYALPLLLLFADKLKHFVYKEFTNTFFSGLKRKMKYVVNLTIQPFDWSTF